MPPRRFEGLTRDVGRRLGERAEDPAAVQPAGAVAPEDRVPVDLARAQLRDGGVTSVGAADRATDAEAGLKQMRESCPQVVLLVQRLLDANWEMNRYGAPTRRLSVERGLRCPET